MLCFSRLYVQYQHTLFLWYFQCKVSEETSRTKLEIELYQLIFLIVFFLYNIPRWKQKKSWWSWCCVCVYVMLSLVNRITQYSLYVDAPHCILGCYCFWIRSKVIPGHQVSNFEIVVIAISQEGKIWRISYLTCGCSIFSRRTLLVLV